MITFTISIHGIDNLEQLGQTQSGQPQVQVTAGPNVQAAPIEPVVPEPKLPKFPPPSIPETPETPQSLALDPQPMVHHIYCKNEAVRKEDAPPPIPAKKPPQQMAS